MKPKNLYEAIIYFCRIMAIFILFAIIVNLFYACESVEEINDTCLTNNCFYVKSISTLKDVNGN